jgi:hypothetical protein
MRTEEEIRGLYNKVLNEIETPDEFDWRLVTPTERMLKKERLDMMKAIFDWVLEEQNND